MLRELFLAVAVVAAAAFNAPLTRVPSSPLARCAASSPLRAPLAVMEEDAAAAEAPAAPEAAAEAPARKPRAKKQPLDQLEVGSTVEGTVRSVQQYGAFVDIGFASDGLLHVSEMADTFVKDANDMFAVGDAVTVRVKSVDLAKGQVALSNKDPNAPPPPPRRQKREAADLSEFASADEKEFRTGTVRSIQSFGAFVNLKDGVDGLLHISEIKEGGVESVAAELSEGQEVQVRVVSFDDKRRIGLSMKPYVELTAEEKAEKAAGRRPRRPRGGGYDDDAAFKMEAADLEKLTLDFETDPGTPFSAAFDRADAVREAKSKKEKYAPVLL
ncbi:hypothetical protein EMIHUDRAFT_436544 [Emiliania huxleyi CCMP1516]|jgi:predicted RNA-binding protein with RPS1 domain|uniref:S1 motif domain-containing protein n=2 Tax=Emiliania huxleyi TaxID=2903 RepID=A0A0D3IYE7_EMIH1|nr:hypothetical protein EMIHUDRAFT_436544 [Emiliania huxleyi CCMP1516]EOD16282.1 hypothetical protein EMIHUDRAFT_436544 [Emiliania huxleyi CCMP1516]|eukprot:XP_005768711.1 hypothetical protein EMIHUDRAFT_436544 [Emiliania huxleyi CCMP1516]